MAVTRAIMENGKANICIVDDHESVLKATSRLLASVSLESKTFADPMTFLEHARNDPPDLVILDMRMQPINGLETLKRLKQIAPATCVIVLSSDDDPATQATVLEEGAEAYFLKPADEEAFLQAVRKALE